MSSRFKVLVPLGTREFVGACIQQSRSLIESDGALQSVAFVGKFDGDVIILPAISHLPKEKADDLIRLAAEDHEADYVLHIDEAWACPAKTEAEADALAAQYGEVRAMPGATEIVVFQFETHAGHFFAHARRETVHDAAGNRRYTFGNVSFELVPVVSGRFMGLLPAKGPKQ